MLYDLLIKNRSYRRFDESFEVTSDLLCELVELARITPSSVNWQPLRFALINDRELNAAIFDNLAWAGLLKDWKGPEAGERPSAYVVILTDTTVAKNMKTDVGIVAQTIMLGAVEKGLGGCMIGSVNRENVYDILKIDRERYTIDLVLALGKPVETVKIVDLSDDGCTNYYRDENGVHYVPKRSVDDLIVFRG